MTRATRWGMVTLGMLLVLQVAQAHAATISEQRSSSGAITIPVFDSSLGTLTNVELQITLASDQTHSGGSHSHVLDPPGAIVADLVGDSLDIPDFDSYYAGQHEHAFTAGPYTGNGLVTPGFSVQVSGDVSHAHTINTPEVSGTSAGAGLVSYNFPAFSSYQDGEHRHSFSNQTETSNYTGSQLSPFLGVADFTISTTPESTSLAGVHGHAVDPPEAWTRDDGVSVNVDPFNSTNYEGNHFHSTDSLQWTTNATFTFTPVPEPSTFLLATLGMISIGVFRRRWSR